jgi:hypothetical protein
MPNSATPFSPGSGKAGDFGTDVVGRGGPPASFAMESFSFESAPRSRVVNSIQNLEIRTEDFKPARGLEMTLESSGSRPVQPA